MQHLFCPQQATATLFPDVPSRADDAALAALVEASITGK
jgi:hypothetical protein